MSEPLTCRLCGAENLPLEYTQGNRDEFRFYRCPVCKLVNYDLAGGLDQEKYAETYIDPLDESIVSNRAQSMTYAFLKKQGLPPGRLLEIGCGNGRLLRLARQDGWTVQGLECSPFLARSVKETLGIEVEVADFLAYQPERAQAFDVVLLRHVLEHLPDSKKALLSIRALLNDSGMALLEFPNIDALDLRFKRLLRTTGLHRRRYPDGYRPGHCNEFCRASFACLLKATGFELAVWETYSYKPVSNWFFNRWPMGNKARTVIRKA